MNHTLYFSEFLLEITEKEACKIHNKSGKSLEMLLNKQVGTMSEDLPISMKSLKQIENENKKNLTKQEK